MQCCFSQVCFWSQCALSSCPPATENTEITISIGQNPSQNPRNATSWAKTPKLNRGQPWGLPELKSTQDVGSLWDDGPVHDLSPDGADY